MKSKTLLSIFVIPVVLMHIFIISVFAEQSLAGPCGENANWTMNSNGVLTISGYGYIDDNSGWEDETSNINTVIINEGITDIDQYIFSDCTNLTEVTLPNSLKTIGRYSFNNCSKLQKIIIPDSVTSIHKYSFKNCNDLVICCNENSYAQEYAKTNGIQYTIIGVITVSFNANGGTGQPEILKYKVNEKSVIPNVIPQKQGYFFVGWATDAKAVSAEFLTGDELSFDVDTDLYAVWCKCEILKSSTWSSIKVNSTANVDGLNLYVVAYKNNRCISIESKAISLKCGTNSFPLLVDMNALEKDIVKVFVWKNMMPCCSSIPVESSKQYTVDFVDWDGTVIDTQIIQKGENATLPQSPSRIGYQFCGWSDDGNDVQSSKTILAQYINETQQNTFKVSNAICNADDTITTTVYLGGDVNLCGFDMNLLYDGNSLEFVSMDGELDYDVIANHILNDNRIKFNFSSSKNNTKRGEIIKIKFKVKGNVSGNTTISLNPVSVIKVGGADGKELLETDYNVENGIVSIE